MLASISFWRGRKTAKSAEKIWIDGGKLGCVVLIVIEEDMVDGVDAVFFGLCSFDSY
jgi:hypothetical protein